MMRNSARAAAIARFPVTRAAAAALYDGVAGASLTATVAGVIAGTRIAIDGGGDSAVEDLRIDDVLASGHRVASVTIRTFDVDALARDADARPVRIAAGAIGDGIPAQALTVAPAQQLHIDGETVPAAALVNGASIARIRPEETVTYVHVRLDAPGCIIIEGLACDAAVPRAGSAGAIARIRAIIDARAAPERGPLDGDVATVSHRGAYGWALDTAHPSAPVALEFVAGGAVVGHAVADVRRPDLEMAGLGEGRCGFLLRLPRPLPASRPALVTLRRAGDGAAMPRTPLLLFQPMGGPDEFAAAIEQEKEAAEADKTVRGEVVRFLAHEVDRLLRARDERPPPAQAADC